MRGDRIARAAGCELDCRAMNTMLRARTLGGLLAASLALMNCTGSTTTPDGAADVVSDVRDVTIDDATDVPAIDVVPMTDAPAPDANDAQFADVVDTITPADAPHDAITSDANVASPCPESPGSGACTREGLVCSYGDDPRPSCRPTSTCTGGQWQLVTPRCTALPSDCGSAPPVERSSCSNEGDLCAYPDGNRCHCTTCLWSGVGCIPEPSPVWHCTPPPSDANCPRTLPNLGQSCTPDGTMCDYDGCGDGRAVQCTGGIWVEALVACPA